MTENNKSKKGAIIVLFLVLVLMSLYVCVLLSKNLMVEQEKNFRYYEGYQDGWDDAIMKYGVAKVYREDEIPDDVRFTLSNGDIVRIIKRVDYDTYSEVWLEVPNIQNITTVYMYYGNNISPPDGWDDYNFRRLINMYE